MSIEEYKCPCCGGSLAFNSNRQKLHCASCNSEYDMKNFRKYIDVVESTKQTEDRYEWDKNDTLELEMVEKDGKTVYICPSCGGEIDAKETTAATKCPYCDSPVIMPGKVAGNLRPDMIIPFWLDKEAAKEKYKDFCKGKRLLPRAFQSDQIIQEIKGIYVPYWLFSCNASGRANYRAQRVKHWKDSDYEYTQTDYYMLSREGKVYFEHVPVDGSVEMNDVYMESLEPYEMSKIVPFDEGYLTGYEAMKYDVDKDDCRGRAQQRIKSSFEQILEQSVDRQHYTFVTRENSNIGCTDGKVQYALFPVWKIRVKYKDKIFEFMMNGQTGKMVGELPVDRGIYWKYALGIFAGSSIISYILLLVFML